MYTGLLFSFHPVNPSQQRVLVYKKNGLESVLFAFQITIQYFFNQKYVFYDQNRVKIYLSVFHIWKGKNSMLARIIIYTIYILCPN